MRHTTLRSTAHFDDSDHTTDPGSSEHDEAPVPATETRDEARVDPAPEVPPENPFHESWVDEWLELLDMDL